MDDQESQDAASEPSAGAPPNRDRRPDPDVIEAEGAARAADETPPLSAASAAPPPEPAPRGGGFRALLAGAIGGLIVSALSLAGGYAVSSPKTGLDENDANRLAALETAAKSSASTAESEDRRQNDAIAGLDKRIAALETSSGPSEAVEQRLKALEAADAASAPKIAAAADAAKAADSEAKDLKVETDAARKDVPGLAARLAKLESAAQAGADTSQVEALNARIAKLEAALASLKTEASAEKPADSAAAIALVANDLHEKLGSGAAFGSEIAALAKLGADPAQIAPLKALANGAPTGAALAASFAALAPQMAGAMSHPEQGDTLDRFMAHLRGLVRVRDLNETAGDDPAAIMSQVEAACRRDDMDAALAAFARLPEGARKVAAGWAAEAGARQAADAALRSIRAAATEKLASGGKS